MGVGRSIVSELSFDNLRMTYPTPRTIVQPATGGDGLWYVIYRFVMASYMIVVCLACLSDKDFMKHDPVMIMHFPVWGTWVATIQSTLLAFFTLANYYSAYKATAETTAKHKEKLRRSSSVMSHRRKKKMEFSVSLPKMPKIYIVIWVFYYIMLYSSMMSFIKYHTGLFRGRLVQVSITSTKKTPVQIMMHQVFFFYCLLDFFVCGIPVRLLHAYVMTIYATFYHICILTLNLVMNHQKNYRPLYDIADVQLHRITLSSIYYVGFSFITPVAAHIIYYGLFLLKSYLIELYFRKTRATTQTNQPAADSSAVPEDKGDVGATEWAPGALRSSKILPISEQEEAEINSINKEESPSNNSIALVDLK